MSFWNYRIVQAENGTFGIHEVYYDEQARPEFITANPVDLCDFESLTDLTNSIEYLQKALTKPVLNIEDF